MDGSIVNQPVELHWKIYNDFWNTLPELFREATET